MPRRSVSPAIAGGSMRSTTRFSGVNPRRCRSRFPRLAPSRPAQDSSTSDSATCTTSSDPRGTNDRPCSARPAPDSASSGGVRDSAHAGPALNSAPAATESPSANSQTGPDGEASTGTNDTRGNASLISARVPSQATPTPATPPASASTTPSTSPCRSSRPAPAPRAALTAACPRSTRASSRFARFARAISRTRPDAANRMVNDREYCARACPTPPSAGTTATCWRGIRGRSSSPTKGCAESHCCRATVRRAAIPSASAPGAARPIA